MRITTVPYEYSSTLVNKYLTGYSEVSGLFEHSPHDLNSFDERYSIVMQDYRTDRSELARILKDYNEALGCGPETMANIEKLKDPDSVVVVTGQQAGVLTGPLYTIYKAVTAIQLARNTAARMGKTVIPVFWVAAEDHDYAEIDHLDLLNRELEVVRLRLNYNPPGKYPVGDIPITEAVYELIGMVEEATNPSQWKDELISTLKGLAEQSGNLADWFAATMTWLFDTCGLVMLNPLNKDLRRLWSGTFRTFFQKADLVNEMLLSGIEKVREFGDVPQVEKEEQNINMFLLVKGERLALLKNGDRFQARGDNRVWTMEQLLEITDTTPELLSPNVVLRPVAQDALLPILAYIAGPGEISYYALYRGIYPLFGQRMPVIFPRANVTLIERGVAKSMEKYGVSFSDGPDGITGKLNEYLSNQDTIGIDSLFESYAGDLKKSFETLIEKVSTIDMDLKVQGSESLNKIMHQVTHFEQKTRQYHRKSCNLAVKRFRNIESQLFPKRSLQERAFNIFPYLFKYGPDLIKRLVEAPLIENTMHKLVYPGAEE